MNPACRREGRPGFLRSVACAQPGGRGRRWRVWRLARVFLPPGPVRPRDRVFRRSWGFGALGPLGLARLARPPACPPSLCFPPRCRRPADVPLSRPASFVLTGVARARRPLVRVGGGRGGRRRPAAAAAFGFPPPPPPSLVPSHPWLYGSLSTVCRRWLSCWVVARRCGWSVGVVRGGVGASVPLPPCVSLPPFGLGASAPTPVRVPGYRVPARRFKDPRGGRPSVPRGRGGAVGPRTPIPSADEAVPVARRGFGAGAPPWAPVGPAPRAPACLGRRGPAGPLSLARVQCFSRPDLFL